jgi:UDP-N-acetylmuramyl pentapeptide phosphotransferase/UDP-N-acetylglucosamine-1-phosphate transferase
MDLIVPAAYFVSAAIATFLLTGGAVHYLRRGALVDVPNERSSHAAPTPSGAGLALIPVVLVAWLIAGHGSGGTFLLWLIGAALLLGALSWIDDRRDLPQFIRLLAQAAAVALILWLWPDDRLVLQGLAPFWLDRLFTGLAWIWFINLFNFMDGIDGISGIETLSLGAGTALVFGLAGGAPLFGVFGAAIAGAAVGFLWWNWQPAKVFLGDVGSVPLGFLLGWLLLELAAAGQWPAALILPFYYLVDTGLTLARRVIRGEKFLQPHREHFYQMAVINGQSHAAVTVTIGVCNVGLIMMALVSIINPSAGIAGGAVMTFATLLIFKRVPANPINQP